MNEKIIGYEEILGSLKERINLMILKLDDFLTKLNLQEVKNEIQTSQGNPRILME